VADWLVAVSELVDPHLSCDVRAPAVSLSDINESYPTAAKLLPLSNDALVTV
jgi:hypothetical protein